MPIRTGDPTLDVLYSPKKGAVSFVDVPEVGALVISGRGAPEGPSFAEAVQALFSVSYTARFALKKAAGDAPKVMPLEAQWWVEGAEAQATIERIASGEGTMADSDREAWCWQAMIVQLPPIDEAMVLDAIEAARQKAPDPPNQALDRLRYERLVEGPCAQLLHVGPFADEQPSIVALHAAIAERGLRPRGRHHEIYLSDMRRTAPEKLRTILRQPVAR